MITRYLRTAVIAASVSGLAACAATEPRHAPVTDALSGVTPAGTAHSTVLAPQPVMVPLTRYVPSDVATRLDCKRSPEAGCPAAPIKIRALPWYEGPGGRPAPQQVKEAVKDDIARIASGSADPADTYRAAQPASTEDMVTRHATEGEDIPVRTMSSNHGEYVLPDLDAIMK